MGESSARADSAVLTVTRMGEEGWRAWREIRLAALADAPDAFADTFAGQRRCRSATGGR